MSEGVVHSCGLDTMLLWLWQRPAAAALIRPLVWLVAALKSKKKKKNYALQLNNNTNGDSVGNTGWIGFLIAQMNR